MFKRTYKTMFKKMFGNKIDRDVVNRSGLVPGLSLASLFVVLCLLPACSINVDKDRDKEGKKHVDIQSPMGD